MPKTRSEDFSSRALTKNIIFSVITFALNMFISFYITPTITNRFGEETYGYLKLSNDLTSYAALFSVALNSMASRFIMLERSRGNHEKAQEYFSSVGVANTILAAIFVIPALLCVQYLDRLFEISPAMVFEVKLTYALTFTNFLTQLFFSIFSNCYYITNTLYLQSLRTSQASILNAVTVLSLFFFVGPKLHYVVFGTLAATLFTVAANVFYTRRLTPDLHFHFRDFRFRSVWTILSSGIWNSITQLSNLLTTQLDLLITNIFIGPETMGVLAVAKTVPNVIINFNATIANVFCPNLMRLYAEGDAEGLTKAAKSAMRFTIPNKVRENSLVMICYGFVSLGVIFLLLQYTSLGVYAILGTNLIGSLIVASLYHLPFSARYVGLSRWAFFPEEGKSLLSFALISGVALGVRQFIDPGASWLAWFGAAIATGALGFICNLFLILGKDERRTLRDKIAGKLGALRGKES